MIGQSELEEAIERVIAGPELKSRLISEEEKRIVAYHEAGHAVVMNALPQADPVHKVSIIARGLAGGYTLSLPEEDRIHFTLGKRLGIYQQLGDMDIAHLHKQVAAQLLKIRASYPGRMEEVFHQLRAQIV